MESWRQVWRTGFVPNLTTPMLRALARALREDDGRLIQQSTTTPPPLMCVQDWPVEAACALGFCAWQGAEGPAFPGSKTVPGSVGFVEEWFAKLCFDCDTRMGNPADCRWFLDWFDDTPRADMRRELLAEVELALKDRERAAVPA